MGVCPMTDRKSHDITPGKYRKIGEANVSVTASEMELDDLHLVDEQIRCVLGMIEDGFKNKGYTEFEIIVRGGYAR